MSSAIMGAGSYPAFGCLEIKHNSPAGAYYIDVAPHTIVTDVVTNVTEAFNGGGASLKAGDEDDDDGYLTTAHTAIATAATVTTPAIKRSSKENGAFTAGKYYPNGGRIMFTFAPGTSPSTGVLSATVVGINLQHGGIR